MILASPYSRAVQTADIIAAKIGSEESMLIIRDERLREKEFGILDRLTLHGIEELHPKQAEFRRILGKFYHRPPGRVVAMSSSDCEVPSIRSACIIIRR